MLYSACDLFRPGPCPMKQAPMDRSDFTVEMAREWFAYDPVEGCVIRIKNPDRGRKVAGQKAGRLHKGSGMSQVVFKGLVVYEQHLVWALCKGHWSPHQLRHRDDNKQNNRIENLCEVTNTQTSYSSLHLDPQVTVEGLSGVVQAPSGRFKAQIFREKIIHLGTFDTPGEAHTAYLRAKQVLHSPLNRGKPTDELLSQLLREA